MTNMTKVDLFLIGFGCVLLGLGIAAWA